MSIFLALYQMIIAPIELLFEMIFQISYKRIGNPGLSIIPVSLTISLICLPLYLRADSIQKETRTKEQSMVKWINHIRRHFTGDERYMMLQAYYRVKKYSPVYTLRNAFPLLLQIPFFIAAYHFLSHLELLKAAALGPIRDLSAPDGLLTIGELTINVLPILMTAVNILSGVISFRNATAKEKIQIYGLAVLFLVLLYRSPSGLVFYWLLNNVFSLIKNAMMQHQGLSNNIRVSFILFASGIAILFYDIASRLVLGTGDVIVVTLAIIIMLPYVLSHLNKGGMFAINTAEEIEHNTRFFFVTCLLMTVLTGVLIPSAVIGSSPMEFVTLSDYQSPMYLVLDAFLLAMGTFVFWLGIFYCMMNKKLKIRIELFLLVASGLSIINYIAFGSTLGTGMGTLTAILQYRIMPEFSDKILIINTVTCIITAAMFYILWARRKKQMQIGLVLVLIVISGMSVNNLRTIQNKIPDIEAAVSSFKENVPSLEMSRSGQNVFVIVMDKAVSGFLPYIFNEKPELKEKYEGFTWYPNTISYGNMTNVGSPALYGGYDYTPDEMNARSDVWLGDKQNEALKLMPVLFNQAGYEVTVCDPAYAGYQLIPDLSIYDEYPEIKTLLLEKGRVRSLSREYLESKRALWRRNFFCYSIMKIAPIMLQNTLYQGGTYFYTNATDLMQVNLGDGKSKSVGGQEEFMNGYYVLKQLPKLTEISDDTKGAFVMMHNHTTHEPILLQEPDYTPEHMVDNTEYDREHVDRFILNGRELHADSIWQFTHYHVNMAALIQVGNWLDYLREQGIYDNTRIIIVADHGAPLKCFEDMQTNQVDAMYFNPLLLVKDFNSSGTLREDATFMTNADTPSIAFRGLIESPINPSTGRLVDDTAKSANEQHILRTEDWQVDVNNGNTFLPGDWFSLENHNIFDMDNWKYLGHY